MEESKVDEYLLQGIHGAKETKPDERRRFLSTLRERVVVALTVPQVKEDKVYSKVEVLMEENPEAKLFLNGNLDYSYLSKYTAIAKKHDVEFTMVTNQEHDSDLGLVLAQNNAINKEDIFINKEIVLESAQKEDEGFSSFFKKLFK